MNDNREVILPFRNLVRESAQREAASDDLGVARCPWCQYPLQMRVDRHGPRFVCGCESSRCVG